MDDVEPADDADSESGARAGDGVVASGGAEPDGGATADSGTEPDCLVCRKHAGDPELVPAGPVAEDELVVVTHLSPWSPGHHGEPVYLGHLFVEPRRHAPGLADLTPAEARAVGWWNSRVSLALREVMGAEHVYAAVIGDGVPHLHVHLLARFPGTPREYWWQRVTEWPGAARGDVGEVSALVLRLREHLAAEVYR